MEVTVILTDADGETSRREMGLRRILSFVSSVLTQGRSIKIITAGGTLEVRGSDILTATKATERGS